MVSSMVRVIERTRQHSHGHGSVSSEGEHFVLDRYKCDVWYGQDIEAVSRKRQFSSYYRSLQRVIADNA